MKFVDFFAGIGGIRLGLERAGHKAVAAGVSNSQLYKQAGNAVSVPVAEAIGRRLREIEVSE